LSKARWPLAAPNLPVSVDRFLLVLDTEKDILVRTGMAKSAFNKLKKLLIGGLKLEVKKIG